ncbi:PEP-CTERM protein-sorting domain-containing protein/MYXO-CTERM domain-containing protein [Nitrosospira sp. Nsp11]|uniref:EDSAP-1 family PEP-CTERM protein n=1 Tax=Nitrosospira sp. Nsp11 TaxID=1855338 RepID=UPI00091B35EF|nr:EDSAP-1 family PEP-CTERM protein [Nitrosospira sp. Nsp11]SHM08290.1 PEP-CTERM protein-sorting domain-containing protein/MYXO-CTERM domain-containing protein [Nitrosospira sp. Nsp11]
MKTKFKLLTLSASLLAGGLVLSEQAQAGAYALSSVVLQDGQIGVTGGTVTPGIASSATSTSGTPAPMNNPEDVKSGLLPNATAASQGTLRTDETVTNAGPTGGPGAFEAGYTPFGKTATAYSWGDGNTPSEQTATSLIAVRNAAEGNIPLTGFANSGAENSSSSSLASFTIDLDGPATMAFQFFANPYAQVILDLNSGPGSKAEANFDNSLTVTAVDVAGIAPHTEVFNWAPDGIINAPGGTIGGIELFDPENLNGTVGTVRAGDNISFSPLNTFAFFNVITHTLPTGRYEFTLDTNESQFVSHNQIPEPATMALVGLGMLGMGFAGRRRRPA